jgi:hypothetical protein
MKKTLIIISILSFSFLAYAAVTSSKVDTLTQNSEVTETKACCPVEKETSE